MSSNRPLDRVAHIRRFSAIFLFCALWEFVGSGEALLLSMDEPDLAAMFPRAALFPPPSTILNTLIEMSVSAQRFKCCDLANDIAVSLYRAALGWIAGSLVGIFIGLTSGRVYAIDHYLTPIIQLFRPLPPVAMIPVIIIWFGIGEGSKIFSIAMAVFFPVWINSYLGARSVPQTYIWTAQTANLSHWQVMSRVVLPCALPNIIAGLRTGIAMAFVMVFVSELTGASAGLGYEINTSYLAFRMDRMLAALMLLGLLGWMADYFLAKSISSLFPWLELQVKKSS